MTKCYKIIRKKIKTIHGDTYLKLEGIHVDVEIPFDLYLFIDMKKHFVGCDYDIKSKSYKVTRIFSKDGGSVKVTSKSKSL